MDISKLKGKLSDLIGKYKYILLVLSVGLALILLPIDPDKKTGEPVPTVIQNEGYLEQSQLTSILSKITGAGRVEVLLSLETSVYTHYQQNTDISAASNERSTTVTVTDSQRNESALVNKTNAPVYRGAIVVCDGADDPQVQLNIISAVANITGLRSDKITVLKMK